MSDLHADLFPNLSTRAQAEHLRQIHGEDLADNVAQHRLTLLDMHDRAHYRPVSTPLVEGRDVFLRGATLYVTTEPGKVALTVENSDAVEILRVRISPEEAVIVARDLIAASHECTNGGCTVKKTLLLEESELGPRVIVEADGGVADLAIWSGIRKYAAVVLTGPECLRLGEMLIEAGTYLQREGAPE